MNTDPNALQHEIEARDKAEVATEYTRPGHVFRPDVDILEMSDAYLILADLPGADEDSIEIQLEKGVITLDARAAAKTVSGKGVEEANKVRPLYAEYRDGGYHREFRITEDIDSDQVSAKMKDGVLELRLPKSAKSQPRRISVQAA